MCREILIAQRGDTDKPLVEEDSTTFFYNHLVESISKLLTDFYLCEVITVETKINEKSLSEVFNVKLQYDTCRDRKKLNFKSDATCNAEIEVSKARQLQKIEVNLDILMTISTLNSGKTIDFKMVNREPNPNSMIMSLGNNLAVNVPTAMKYYLQQKWAARRTC